MARRLPPEEAHLLRTHLGRYLEHLDRELVRTDQHELQHKLAGEIKSLQLVVERLGVEKAA